ncbi:MAG: glycosyltransferase [Tenericutes bacterium]|nr:glycosyltransferase [Mycoplasmatota bacterium]
MKNIIVLSHLGLWSMDNKKGAPSFYKTIEAYVRSGWNVSLVQPSDMENKSIDLIGLKIFQFQSKHSKLENIRFLGSVSKIISGYSRLRSMMKVAKKLIISSRKQTIIYSYEVHSVRAGKILSKKYNLPLITRFQGTILTNVNKTFVNKLRYYPHFSALKTAADLVIMTNDGTQGDKVLKEIGNNSDNIKFWINGVDKCDYKYTDEMKINHLKRNLGIGNEDYVLLTVSRLVSWKRVDRAIYSCYKAKEKIENIKLIIVGDGSDREKLRKYATNLGITNNVIFVGAVNHEDVKLYLKLCNVFMSLYDLSNVGNPLLEAMSCGCAIITLDVGDTKKFITDYNNGLLVELSNIEVVSDKIIELFTDNALLNMLKGNAKEYSDSFLWTWNERMDAELNTVSELYIDWFGRGYHDNES